jgi:HTH-type transcriptional regulator/antitoxin HigA
MAGKTTATRRGGVRTQPDTYFALVERFPLVHIQDRAHLRAAGAVIVELLRRDLDAGEEAYLDALTDLVEVYEAKHVPIPDAPEGDVLRLLLASNGLSQSALARAVGISQSTISAVLNGSRTLTRAQVQALAAHFGVSPAVFFSA